MAKKYYVFQDQSTATAFMGTINGHPIFDNGGIIPLVNGQLAPEKTHTLQWYDDLSLREMLDGRWALSEIPSFVLDYHNIDQATVDGIQAAFSYEILELTESDFVPEVEEE